MTSLSCHVRAVSTFRASIRGRGLLVPPPISSRSRSSLRRPRNREHGFHDRAASHGGAKCETGLRDRRLTRTTRKVCQHRRRAAWSENIRTFTTATRYVGIIGGNLCCCSQGSVAEFGCNCRDIPLSATGGPHSQYRVFALLAYFFRHTRSLTNPSSRGALQIPLL